MRLHRLLAASAIVQGVGLLLTMLLGVQLARYLGPANYGLYGVVMAVVSIGAVVAQFGLPLFATREAARPDVNVGSLLRWLAPRAVGIAICVSLTLALVLIIAGPIELEHRRDLIFLSSALITGIAVQASAVGILRGVGRNLTGQIVDLLLRPAIVVTVVFILNIANTIGVASALAAQLGTIVVSLIFSLTFLMMASRRSAVRCNPIHSPRWIATSSTYMANSLLIVLNGNYPMIIAAFYVSGTELGILRVAIASAIVVRLPTSIANIATAPLVARQVAAGDRSGLADTLSQTTILSFAVTAAAWLLLIIGGKPAIAWLFGPDYAGAYVPLLILGVGQMIIAAFGISGTYLNLTARERLVTAAFLIAVPLGIVSSFVLTAPMGVAGAAVGAVVMAGAWHTYIFGIRSREIDAPVSLIAALRHANARWRRT